MQAFQRALLFLAFLPALAHAELMLNPTRVVLAKNQRAAQIELINNGEEPATYRIGLVNRRMSETGELRQVTLPDAGEQFADAMLAYSPRQITLVPGTAQVVRVMLRKPDGLADGEYRSHLHFEKLAGATGASSVEGAAPGAQQIGVVLKTLIGASIPVIVRQGETRARVTLAQLALLPGAPVLSFSIERSGNSSVYGDIQASFTGADGKVHVLGKASGVAVYVPNPLRRAQLALLPPAGVALARGTLHLSYRERPEAGARLLAEAFLPLP